MVTEKRELELQEGPTKLSHLSSSSMFSSPMEAKTASHIAVPVGMQAINLWCYFRLI